MAPGPRAPGQLPRGPAAQRGAAVGPLPDRHISAGLARNQSAESGISPL